MTLAVQGLEIQHWTNMKSLLGCLAILLIGASVHICNAFKYNRATGKLTIELLIVADYSEFNKWYQLTSGTHTHRVNVAKQNLTRYVGALIHSSNNVYKSLEPHNIFINIKLVDIIIKTTPSDSPWTETVKVAHGSSYEVDPTRVLPLFQPKSVDLQKTVPHDHAMVLTKYALYHGGGSTFSGYAYTEAECKAKSVSLVEDNEDFYTAQLIAHEIGHSLGCHHDGQGNSCPVGAGYAMENSFILANKNKWIFSSCSVTAINNYLHDLTVHHGNCLQSVDNSHPDSSLTTATHEWYGQIYDLDTQCRIKYGSKSYLCRNQYPGNYTNVCLKMFCYDPVKDGCYFIDGGDGSPCGTGKWCMSNECVAHSGNHLQNISDSCVAGDQAGIVYDGRTCQQIGTSHSHDCHRHSVSRKCCYTCNHLQTLTHTAPTDIDAQCKTKHGTGSFMCRAAKAYDNKTYADAVCSNLQCHDPNRDNWCLSSVADDTTSCGFHKWCQNGVCVHDTTAPAVPDNCPWGNQQGIVVYGLTCDQIKQPENQWRCYDDFIAKICCATCNAIKRNVGNCTYGDKSDWCKTHIATSADRQTCYWGHNTDLCCESCYKYRNNAHAGCEYGDKINSCKSNRCVAYGATTLQKCCETCRNVAIVG